MYFVFFFRALQKDKFSKKEYSGRKSSRCILY